MYKSDSDFLYMFERVTDWWISIQLPQKILRFTIVWLLMVLWMYAVVSHSSDMLISFEMVQMNQQSSMPVQIPHLAFSLTNREI